MIIVEGPDGSGKTTLVNQLNAEWGVPIQPRVVSKEAQALSRLDDWVEVELDKGFGWRLYDRFAPLSAPHYLHLPNPTYAGRFRELDWMTMILQKLSIRNPVLIYCLPPLGQVLANLEGDQDNLIVSGSAELIYWRYHYSLAQALANHNTSVVHYDYTNPGESLDHIARLMRWAQVRIQYKE